MKPSPQQRAQQLLERARELSPGFTRGVPLEEFSLKCAKANAEQILLFCEDYSDHTYWSKVVECLQNTSKPVLRLVS